MFKVYFADKDTYITNKFVNGISKVSSSVGYASTIDLFKLKNVTKAASGTIELSRALIHFDISNLIEMHQNGLIDVNHSSFKSYVKLSDVYGGQTTPSNFELVLSPLSRSFDEGVGKDIVYLSDYDAANFLTSSYSQGLWNLSGAGFGAPLGYVGGSDYFTTGSIANQNINFEITQSFKTGFENLFVDITPIVSATVAGLIPDEGFRLAFSKEIEDDDQTYFVKRFASRHVYDQTFQPVLIVKFDDSISDDSATMFFNSSGSLFLYNYDQNSSRNLLSGSSEVTGSNSLILKIETPVSGGKYQTYFTGSQFKRGSVILSGTYYADVYIPLTNELQQQLLKSGSVEFTPIWTSLDETITFATGSVFSVKGPQTFTYPLNKKKYVVSAYGIPQQLKRSEKTIARIHIFDSSDPTIKLSKFVLNSSGKIIKDCYYSIRDMDKNETVVSFDKTFNSTKISSDSHGLYFYLDGRSVIPNRTYTIDILTVEGNDETIYKDVSVPFQVIND